LSSKLAQILAEEGLLPKHKQAEEFDELANDRAMLQRFRERQQQVLNPTPTGWRNYNSIGRREFGSSVLSLVESNTPATLSILFRDTNEEEFDRIKKKWWGKGMAADERGVKGKIVWHRGKKLLIAQIGGKWAIVSNNFPV